MEYLVVGAGVAGVCCAKEILQRQPNARVTILAATDSIKSVENVEKLTRTVEIFNVVERPLSALQGTQQLQIVQGVAESLDAERKVVRVAGGGELRFDALCVASGASPRMPFAPHPAVVTIRDTESVAGVAARLAAARRVLVVGNGGIALELIGALAVSTRADIRWPVRHCAVGDAFFDIDAAAFLLRVLCARAETAGNAVEVHTTTAGGRRQAGDAAGLGAGQHAAPSAIRRELAPQQQQQQQEQQEPAPERGAFAAERQHDQATPPQPLGALPQRSAGAGYRARRDAAAPISSQTADQQQQPPHDWQRHTAGPADEVQAQPALCGAAVGPKWLESLESDMRRRAATDAAGSASSTAEHRECRRQLRVDFGCEVEELLCTEGGCPEAAGVSRTYGGEGEDGRPWPVVAVLSSGERVGADVVVVAAGVDPNTQWRAPHPSTTASACCSWLCGSAVSLSADGGVLVDRRMESMSCPGVFAAGDAATAAWATAPASKDGDITACGGPHWFQMRLWSQARAMGVAAARAMTGADESAAGGFAFELLTHATRFFGLRVVLLGRYNAQGLDQEPESDIRSYVRESAAGPSTDPLAVAAAGDAHFARVVLLRGRLVGAALIGEEAVGTLAETFENLILDGLDVGGLGPALLDPEAEIDDYFD